MTRTLALGLAFAASFTLAATAARAQQAATPADASVQMPITELACRTLLQLGGEERNFTIVYLHGFVSGRLNQPLLPVRELAEATDRLIDRCIDKPSEKALTVMEQVRASRR